MNKTITCSEAGYLSTDQKGLKNIEQNFTHGFTQISSESVTKKKGIFIQYFLWYTVFFMGKNNNL